MVTSFEYLVLLKTGNRLNEKNVRWYWKELLAESDTRAMEEAKRIAEKNIGRIIYIICKDRGENAFVKFD